MIYDLPKQLSMGGVLYDIRSDYRVALDIITALNSPELTDREKSMAVLIALYPEYDKLTDINEALKQASWFLAFGEDENDSRPSPKKMDWEQDFKLIVAPINRVLGFECRSVEYLHFWTFISAYYEIGECAFANVVSIRDKLARGKKLEKWERDFYNENRSVVDLKIKATAEEQAIIDDILGYSS